MVILPLDFQVAALIAPSFSAPPIALTALSTMASASASPVARPTLAKENKRVTMNAALKRSFMDDLGSCKTKGSVSPIAGCLYDLETSHREVDSRRAGNRRSAFLSKYCRR